ncbi:Uncharacterised protein [Mycobacteroides abscessus subsp. abscessus]|nr:Uncharacterised protein [Mycobacteroides abscessus subsp. abscessus]SIM05797.1 Uncharacterised protein [Mycobacteroides abscessus subsp. abscessus]SLI24523.1 Uncharacterised protein [Mycobacteroides abscessus subsp. abscessus]
MAESFIERNGTAFQIAFGALFVILAAFLSWYFGSRNRMTKTIDYEVLSNVAVLTSTGARPERLKILFDDTEASDPSITQIRIENTGKQVIEPEDFLTCIQICRENCTILEWGIVDQSADGVSGDIGMTWFPGECERIDSTPGTMNPGDWFILQIVFDGDKDEPLCVTSRMRGEKRPMQAFAPLRRTKRLRAIFAALGAGIGTLAGYAIAKYAPDALAPRGAVVVTLSLGILLSALQYRKLTNRLKISLDRKQGK